MAMSTIRFFAFDKRVAGAIIRSPKTATTMQASRSRMTPAHDAAGARSWLSGTPFVPLMIGLAALAIGALVVFRPAAPGAPVERGAAAAEAAHAKPARPALSAEEERYIRALWPIHGDVQRSALRMSLGQILYTTQDLGAPELKARVEQALGVYQSARSRMHELQPPASLRTQHDDYLVAVGLFEESAREVMKMFVDGRESHLLAAHPKGQAGADKIREIGGRFWPNEFAPH
jgi:hypothetical protein